MPLFLRSSKTATRFSKHFEWNDDTQYTMNTVTLEEKGENTKHIMETTL